MGNNAIQKMYRFKEPFADCGYCDEGPESAYSLPQPSRLLPFTASTMTLVPELYETLAFAGGGNRCSWQAGAMTELLDRGWELPRCLVGTSAGAAIAMACVTIGPAAALERWGQLLRCTERPTRGMVASEHGPLSQHENLYRRWLHSLVSLRTLDMLRHGPRHIVVAVSRPAHRLGLRASVIAGTFAYLIDQLVSPEIHPRLPSMLGLRQEFIDLRSCETVAGACSLLRAAAAAVPYIRPVQLGGRWALDGGYVDNAPIPSQSVAERHSTLVMLTRHDKSSPSIFICGGRTYWQPSRPVPVQTWECSTSTDIIAAFELGRSDARALLHRGRLRTLGRSWPISKHSASASQVLTSGARLSNVEQQL